jgi:hypothetical protein
VDAEATRVQPAAESGMLGTHKPSIAEHPRAARYVRQARQAAGLIGFLIGGWTSMATSTLAETLLRALLAGIICQVVVWGAAVALFRHLILAELKGREQALMAAAKARVEAQERAHADNVPRGGAAQGTARP